LLKYIEVTGKNEDEAIAKALAQLCMDRDDVSVEILERAKTGFLGIGSVPARIKVTYEGPDDEIVEEPTPVVEAPKPAPEKKPAKPAPEKKAVKPVEEKPAAEAPAKVSAPVAQCDDEIAARISTFLTGLFAHMDVEAAFSIVKEDDTYSVILEGDDAGALIGRRGETLDAIQQLTGYAINHGRSRRFRIHVDAESYRARREESLERLARKVAAKAVKYRRSVTLEPMNAYERHVIHTALQDYPNVTTHSTGTEPNRRTVVSYDPSKK